MSSPRAEIFERLAGQSEIFLSGWAEKEQAGLKTFKRIWRLKELAYRPLAEFPDLAERFRLFEAFCLFTFAFFTWGPEKGKRKKEKGKTASDALPF
ncbi:MAG: hypothetical protein L0Z48_12310, partial [candidate division Zixibacteria bacterium]|nr:hypothetical protein [candidate division Zixibacteria bacterium]